MTKTARFPSIDGWRAVSIIMVLGSHCKVVVGFPKKMYAVFDWLFDGDVGVRFFFVISGFLITHLLLQEKIQTGGISLKKFYLRRALRILPVYYFYLLFVFLLQLFTPWKQHLVAWIGNLTFTTNFFTEKWITGHLWSLAVEEQFYILWPLLLIRFLLTGNEKRAFYLLAIPLAIAPFSRVISNMQHAPAVIQPFFKFYAFQNFFDSLAAGCITALLLTWHGEKISRVLNKLKKESILLAAALVLTPYILNKLEIATRLMVAIKATFQAAGFSILLLQSILSPQLFKPLNFTIVKQLGVLSYSIYIWQMLFCANPQWFGFPEFWFMSFPGWLLAACLAGALSYYGFEKPLLRFRARLRPANPSLIPITGENR